MRLSVEHRTAYRFSAAQARLVQALRLTPPTTHDQTVAAWRIDVDCDARLRTGRDGFGNIVTMLYAEGPLDGIEIAVSGEVLTSHSDGVLHGVTEPLPERLFLRSTVCTTPDQAVAAFARDAAKSAGEDVLDAMHRLNGALHTRFTLDPGRPQGLSAAEAFARETATPRDMAHLFVAAARSLGVPARYVGGYALVGVDGDHRPTPHAWAEAHVEGLGWLGFDPCLGLSPEERHVRVAVALDATGAAPVAGSRLGEGEEVLDVDVSVSREE